MKELFDLFLAILPILTLLVCLLGFKFSAARAAACGFIVAFLISVIGFRAGINGTAIMLAKGISLALFVIFIIWGAIFLYEIINDAGALAVINKNVDIIIDDKYVQFLLIAWCFSSFMQGIAGFGVPVIICAPLLVAIGFDPLKSLVGILLGYGWAICVGSMGTPIYAMNMVTKISMLEIVPEIACYDIVVMVLMGFAVSFVYGGKGIVAKSLSYVLPAGFTMGVTLLILAKLQMISVMGIVTGLVGMITIFVEYRLRTRKTHKKTPLYKSKINMLESSLPYIAVVVVSIGFYMLDPKWSIDLSFPGYKSLTGLFVKAADDYVKFNILKFPFTVMLIASIIAIVLYRKKGCLDDGYLKKALKQTVEKCIPPSTTVVLLMCMAQVMMDSTMIDTIAKALVHLTGKGFPVVSPFIGLLGAFITASCTNSNILFGNLQEVAAESLGLNAALMCAAQIAGASVGAALGPTTITLGATACKIPDQESTIYSKILKPILGTGLVLGAVNILFEYLSKLL